MNIRNVRAISGVMIVLTGCSTVPETGRKQIMLISREKELEMGQELWLEVKGTSTPSGDAVASEVVQKVGRRIADASGATYDWEFALFESEQVNAFCLPGGKVSIMTGILPVALNEAGLAAVMGHEVAHAVCRHGAERYSQGKAISVAGQVVSRSAGAFLPGYGGAVDQAYALGSNAGVALPFSRAHEAEADRVGMMYMARAGYDPEEAVRFWQRMDESAKQSGKKGGPAWLSTHPSHGKRIEKLREYLPEAKAAYEAAPQRLGLGGLLPAIPVTTTAPAD